MPGTQGTPFATLPMPPCAALLGWQLIKHDAAKGWLRIGFDGRPEFLNPAGYVQGGFLTAMLDDTMGPAVWLASGGTLYTSTIHLNISFLQPARRGPLYGEGQVLQMGKTVAFVEAQLMDEVGQVLARANAAARLVPSGRAVRA
jgi:uncharacterized protein (TIGR00369 family)